MSSLVNETRRESVKEIINKFDNDEYDIPDFQRDCDIWSMNDKKTYIKNIFSRCTPTDLCITRVKLDSGNKMLIIDGLQRITALKEFKRGLFKVKLDNIEGAIKGGMYCYKSNQAKDNHCVLDEALKKYFNEYELSIKHSKEVITYEQAIMIFKAIQYGSPVSDHTLMRMETYKINTLIKDAIEALEESEEKENIRAFDQFTEKYKEHAYFRILINACIYWNDIENSAPNTADVNYPKKVKVDIINEHLQILFDNFAEFYSLLSIDLDHIRTNLIMFKFVSTCKIRNAQQRSDEMKKIADYVYKYGTQGEKVKLYKTEGYYFHLLQMYN